MQLGFQRVLIASPNLWGNIQLSKHHYAKALARAGVEVLFLEPPADSGPNLTCRQHPDLPNLKIVRYRRRISRRVMAHLPTIYTVAVAVQIREMLRELGIHHLDVAWSFDQNYYPDVRAFGADMCIYHPVDQFLNPLNLLPATSADLVITVAEVIRSRLSEAGIPSVVVPHGVAEPYARIARDVIDGCAPSSGSSRVTCGYVGNTFARQLDRGTFRTIIEENGQMDFHVWGPRVPGESTVGAALHDEALGFANWLSARENVVMHGVCAPDALAPQLARMDVNLLCYDTRVDPNCGANSHKVFEYLATGRPMVANHIGAHAEKTDIIEMAPPGDNTLLPHVFAQAIRNLPQLARRDLAVKRAELALANSYETHLATVSKLLASKRRADSRRHGSRAAKGNRS